MIVVFCATIKTTTIVQILHMWYVKRDCLMTVPTKKRFNTACDLQCLVPLVYRTVNRDLNLLLVRRGVESDGNGVLNTWTERD